SVICSFACFFFSSRRRHTRFSRDWSSDVCSSDLDYHLGYMSYYFYLSCASGLVLAGWVWQASSAKSYRNIHNFLKLIIVLGVLSIALIDPKVVIHGKELIQQLPD